MPEPAQAWPGAAAHCSARNDRRGNLSRRGAGSKRRSSCIRGPDGRGIPIRRTGTTSLAPMARRRSSKGFAISAPTSRRSTSDCSASAVRRRTGSAKWPMRLAPAISDPERCRGPYGCRACLAQFRNRRRELPEKTHAHPLVWHDRTPVPSCARPCGARGEKCCDGSETRAGPRESRPRRPRSNSRAAPTLPRDSRQAWACRGDIPRCG